MPSAPAETAKHHTTLARHRDDYAEHPINIRSIAQSKQSISADLAVSMAIIGNFRAW